LAVNQDGRIIASGDGGLVLVDCDTEKVEVLADKVNGAPLRRINDIQPDGDGGLYAGCINPPPEMGGTPLPGGAPLVLVSPDRTVRVVAEGIMVSNGIGLT